MNKRQPLDLSSSLQWKGSFDATKEITTTTRINRMLWLTWDNFIWFHKFWLVLWNIWWLCFYFWLNLSRSNTLFGGAFQTNNQIIQTERHAAHLLRNAQWRKAFFNCLSSLLSICGRLILMKAVCRCLYLLFVDVSVLLNSLKYDQLLELHFNSSVFSCVLCSRAYSICSYASLSNFPRSFF